MICTYLAMTQRTLEKKGGGQPAQRGSWAGATPGDTDR